MHGLRTSDLVSDFGRTPALPDQRKCTGSVSPPSSSPGRPPPKRLPPGSAFILRRSVLGAIRNLLTVFDDVKPGSTYFVANCTFHVRPLVARSARPEQAQFRAR